MSAETKHNHKGKENDQKEMLNNHEETKTTTK